MDYNTPKKMERRWNQIRDAKIESLKRSSATAIKNQEYAKAKILSWIAQKEYGLDCDYIPGLDDGSELPTNNQYEIV